MHFFCFYFLQINSGLGQPWVCAVWLGAVCFSGRVVMALLRAMAVGVFVCVPLPCLFGLARVSQVLVVEVHAHPSGIHPRRRRGRVAHVVWTCECVQWVAIARLVTLKLSSLMPLPRS